MFTNNYIALRYNTFWGVSSGGKVFGSTTISGKGVTTALNTSAPIYDTTKLYYGEIGENLYGYCRALLTTYASSQGATYPGVYFGSGTTPATREDYTLEAPIESGLSVDSGTLVVEDDESGQYQFSRSYILTNTSDTDITVSEIGCFAGMLVGGSKTYYQVLMDRTLLSSPVTIAPGESKLIIYKFSFNW